MTIVDVQVNLDEQPKHFPKKTMITVWWSEIGIIHYRFLPPEEAIKALSYCREIAVFNEKLQKIYPALTNRKGQFFSMTAPNHTLLR